MAKKSSVPPTLSGVSLKLTIKDRLVIRQNLYPEKASLLEQIICEDIEEKIKLTQNEMERVNFRDQVDPETRKILGWTWDEKKDTGKTIQFSNSEIEFIKNQVDKLDQNREITRNMVAFCKMIKNIELKKE